MSTAKKFLALAIAAYGAKQYEDAGVLFAQAAGSPEASALGASLASDEEADRTPGAAHPAPSEENAPDAAPDAEEASQAPANVDAGSAASVVASDDAYEFDDLPGEEVSVSSVSRRQTTTLFQIGQILSASMQALSSEEEEDEDADEDLGTDPDVPGQDLIPASFSSVSVKPFKSPVSLKI